MCLRYTLLVHDTLNFVHVQPKTENDDYPIDRLYSLRGCPLERESNVTSDMFAQ